MILGHQRSLLSFLAPVTLSPVGKRRGGEGREGRRGKEREERGGKGRGWVGREEEKGRRWEGRERKNREERKWSSLAN